MKPESEVRRDAGQPVPEDLIEPPLNERRACQECVGEWQRVRCDLVRWVRGCGLPADEADDAAGEAIKRCWKDFGCGACRASPWTWTWLCRVALNFARNQQKVADRARVDGDSNVESLPAAGPHDGGLAERMHSLIAALKSMLGRAELETLQCLQAGILDNAKIAQIRGVSIRAVQLARLAILSAAEQAWNFC
jgi:DNA-directed RNA polymerase specialized sigma24 family protein